MREPARHSGRALGSHSGEFAAVSSPAVLEEPSAGAASRPAASSVGASIVTHDSTQIYGAVTADSERRLILTYLGGDCDVSARGEAAENGPITVHVVVKSTGGICSAVGYIRTVVVQLSAPWADRVVLDQTGATVPVIDATLLLRPSWLPDGFDGGGITVGASEGGDATADQEWGPPSATSTSAAGALTCPPTPGVSLVQGYGINAGEPLVAGSYSLANGIPLTVTRDQLGDLQLYWTPTGHPKGWTVELLSSPACGNPQVPLDTLLKIANGLR